MSKKENKEQRNWKGVSQSERLVRALLPEHIRTDERKLSDLLSFAGSFGELVKFYPQDNGPVGDWSEIFKRNICVFLAEIITTNLIKIDRINVQHIDGLERARNDVEKKAALKRIFTHIIEIALLLNNWYIRAVELNDDPQGEIKGIELELETAIIQKLRRNLLSLKEYDLASGQEGGIGETMGLDYSQFHEIWKLDEAEAKFVFEPKSTFGEKIGIITSKTRLIYRAFYSVLAFIVQIAEKYFQEALDNKQNHKPDAALFIAFAQLFNKAQVHLNTLTSRHLDYYYYEVLQQNHRQASPDKVNVYFELAEHVNEYYLDEGIKLDAGTNDQGLEIIYSLEHDLLVNKASIAALKTIFISKNALIGIGSSFQLITNIYSAPHANSKDGIGAPFNNGKSAWPTFGEEQFDKPAAERTMISADVGFAISAPILYLDEGERKVQMLFKFDRVSASTLNRLILDISKNKGFTRPNSYYMVFQDSLEIQLTSEEGWLNIKDYLVSPPEDFKAGELSLTFSLAPSAPSIVGYNEEIHGAGYQTKHPIVRILLLKEASSYVYSFLRDLVMETVFINVDVKNVKGLELYNHIGRLDPNTPFQPFGPLPKAGSYLLVGKDELFKKTVTGMSFNVEWQGLPIEPGGMEYHYKDYKMGIKNESFLVRLSALSNNIFYPEEIHDRPLLPLFETNEDGVLCSQTVWRNIDLDSLHIQPDYDLEEVETFDNYTRSGFFKVELASPSFGFGGDIYPSIFAKSAIESSKPKYKGIFRKLQSGEVVIPNPPISPTIKSFSIDYTASARVNVLPSRALDKDRKIPETIFHIHPFGIIKTFSAEATLNRALAPQFDENAYLYIGLLDLRPPQRLSMLFQMKESEVAHTYRVRPEISWCYLRQSEWIPISEEKLLFDTTDSFTTSGIILLDLPADMEKGAEILDKNLHWLRVAVRGDTSMLSKTINVFTQAASAFRISSEEEDKDMVQLEPDSVLNLVEMVPEIRSVIQPHASFGGQKQEEKDSFYTRISERLRHKNRVITSWDYERIVLENFPSIYQVKCVRHLGNEKFVEYGSVLIVVVPRIDHAQGYFEPKVNYNTLQAIKDHLRIYSSPFVNIEVRNPVYEKLKISCGVIFKRGKNNGVFLEKLNRDIQEFICPWMYGTTMDLDLGGSLNKNTVLSFVEKRPYVKFITRFSMVQVINDEGYYSLEDTARDLSHSPIITGSTPWSVLVPLNSHPISFLDRVAYQSPEPAGVDTMIVGTDFIIKDEADELMDDYVEAIQYERFTAVSRKKEVEKTGKRYFLKIKLKKDKPEG